MLNKQEQNFARNKEEYVLCAAIWFDDGRAYTYQPSGIDIGFILCGHRHHAILEEIGGTVGERIKQGIRTKQYGFLTSKNCFVSREEAANITLAQGQIEYLVEKLYSEHLY